MPNIMHAEYDSMKTSARLIGDAGSEFLNQLTRTSSTLQDLESSMRGNTAVQIRNRWASFTTNGGALAQELDRLSNILYQAQQIIEAKDQETRSRVASTPNSDPATAE
jgi:uncharacterized protein YukE